jgi:hypothetical protein
LAIENLEKRQIFELFGIKEKCKFYISLLLEEKIGSGFSRQGFLIGRIQNVKIQVQLNSKLPENFSFLLKKNQTEKLLVNSKSPI